MDMQKKGNKTMMIYILFVLYIACSAVGLLLIKAAEMISPSVFSRAYFI